jgi:hypothetical protein
MTVWDKLQNITTDTGHSNENGSVTQKGEFDLSSKKNNSPAAVTNSDEGGLEYLSNLENRDPTREHQPPYWLALQQLDQNSISEFEYAWLTKRGVTFKALLGDWPIGAANVTFDGKGHFNFADDGERALTFVTFNAREPIDLIAWHPRTGKIGSYTGAATFLGDEDDAINPGTWSCGGDLIIHATPLEWLQHEREGLVIINFKRAATALRNAKSIFCEDINAARKLRPAIRAASKPLVKIYTTAQQRRKAHHV